jgi:nucleotide-binding universal stress UspA family protein
MFKKIMVCLDGSGFAEQILPYALEQARRFESNIVLCRVFSEPTLTGIGIPGFPAVPIETTGMAEQATKNEFESVTYLNNLANRIQSEHGISAECVTMVGAPGESIVKYAAENQIELITIATHGRGGLGRALIGSVADYVIRQSGIPILLIRPK